MIGLVTDSNTQLPEVLRNRYDIRVVPLTIVIGGTAYLEGVDLDSADFLAAMRAATPMSTAAPSPGQFAHIYAELAAEGAERILSVHVGTDLSATLAAARLGAESCPVPVEFVDTASASFAAGCCVWAAAEALRCGRGADGAVHAALRAAARIGNIFIVSSLELARRGGRMVSGARTTRIPVLALEGNRMQVVGEVADQPAAVDAMTAYFDGWLQPDDRVRVGVGHTDNPELADQLATAVAQRPSVDEVVSYNVGPSVAVHTGPGTVGAAWTVV